MTPDNINGKTRSLIFGRNANHELAIGGVLLLGCAAVTLFSALIAIVCQLLYWAAILGGIVLLARGIWHKYITNIIITATHDTTQEQYRHPRAVILVEAGIGADTGTPAHSTAHRNPDDQVRHRAQDWQRNPQDPLRQVTPPLPTTLTEHIPRDRWRPRGIAVSTPNNNQNNTHTS